jgi:DNA-binding transcriptional LysR family regulator
MVRARPLTVGKMRRNQFTELSAFVVVAEHASFSRAAERLGLSTATLSQSVRALEEHLGVRLLNRTTRSVALTEAGERLLGQLRPLLDGFDAAVDSVNAFREKPSGNLRLTMPPPVARFVLGPVLGRFLDRYPEIVIEATVESGLTDIVAGRYDAGIRRGSVVARDMIAVRVTDDMHYRVVASRPIIWRATAARGRRPICRPTTASAIGCRPAVSFPGCSWSTARPSSLRSKGRSW